MGLTKGALLIASSGGILSALVADVTVGAILKQAAPDHIASAGAGLSVGAVVGVLTFLGSIGSAVWVSGRKFGEWNRGVDGLTAGQAALAEKVNKLAQDHEHMARALVMAGIVDAEGRAIPNHNR